MRVYKFDLMIVALVFLFLFGCTNTQQQSSFPKYPDCKINEGCTVDGIFSVVEINHVKMGKLILNNGQCINISLPKNLFRKYKSGENISLSGFLYETPAVDELTAELKLDGRRIGWSQCNKLYIFVE